MAQRAYFGLKFVPTLLIALIPVVGWICSIIVCFQREQYWFAVLRIPFCWLFWIPDIICLCIHKDLVWFA